MEETIMTAVTCINCGIEGVLNVYGLHNDDSLKVFRRLGRNHVSGHQHYQCPVCKMVLLVDPVLIRENAHIFKKKSANYPLVSPGSPYNNIYPVTASFIPTVPISAGLAM
jgi:hypothetical protein